MAKKIRVLLADDHPLVRAGLRATMESEADIEMVGEATNRGQVQPMCSRLKPDVLLLDLDMPGPPIADVLRQVQSTTPEVKILILTAYHNDTEVQRLLTAGVAGYVLKEEAPETVLQAIHAVYNGATWYSGVVLQRFMQRQSSSDPLLTLTDRERDVLEKIALGWDNARIAGESFLAEQTVRNYISRLYTKIGVTTRAEAIVWARERGLGREGFKT